MRNLIMISSTSHLSNMGDEFYSILKLVSGEEIFALVCVDESDDEPILVLHNPIKMKTLSQVNHLNYIKVTPWMENTDEDMFVNLPKSALILLPLYILNAFVHDPDEIY